MERYGHFTCLITIYYANCIDFFQGCGVAFFRKLPVGACFISLHCGLNFGRFRYDFVSVQWEGDGGLRVLLSLNSR
jgi:hypothetical protein